MTPAAVVRRFKPHRLGLGLKLYAVSVLGDDPVLVRALGARRAYEVARRYVGPGPVLAGAVEVDWRGRPVPGGDAA